MTKTALITGVAGQDGSFLAEQLLDKGYKVYGTIRRASNVERTRIDHLNNNPDFYTYYGDIVDGTCLHSILASCRPDEIYNLAAMSHVGISFEIPEYSAETCGLGVLKLLEAIKNTCPEAKLYQASTSEMFGGMQVTPYNEDSPFIARSPYAAAKIYAYWIVRNYREAYGISAWNGILFNHESERRGKNFVTRKISWAIARISLGLQDCLFLGNIDSKRDWGYAPEYTEAMWMMLQDDIPEDYVVSTGFTYSVRDFVTLCFSIVGITISWTGSGLDEVGICSNTNRVLVRIDKKYFRPTEVSHLVGDSSKIHDKLGWKSKTSVNELASIMVHSDLRILANA